MLTSVVLFTALHGADKHMLKCFDSQGLSINTELGNFNVFYQVKEKTNYKYLF